MINFAPVNRLCHTLFLLAFGLTFVASAAQSVDTAYFRSPLNIPLLLSATFGELRIDHFHAGIDIKTQGKTGFAIYAPADGYVSRVKITLSGYGKSLYITHTNNTTTVYGHLSRFNPAIEKYIQEIQYSRQEYAVEAVPEPGRFAVKQGDVIGYTGNSGYSFGPHLHFEIRNNNPENVLLYKFNIADRIRPEIVSLVVYPVSTLSRINGENQKKIIPVLRADEGRYVLSPDSVIRIYGPVGFGIEAYDKLDGSANRCGIFSQHLTIDSETVCHVILDKISFDEMRFVNTYMDYAEKIKAGKEIHTSFVSPYNELSVYSVIKNRGIIRAENGREHRGRYTIKDTYGNTSVLDFRFTGDSNLIKQFPEYEQLKFAALFAYNHDNTFDTAGLQLKVPAFTLYDDLLFEYRVSDTIPPGYFSPVHTLHNGYTPVHRNIQVSIMPQGLPGSLTGKAVIAMWNEENKRSCPGGEYKNGWITAQIRSFGRFAIGIDTTRPGIKLLNGKPGGDYTREHSLRFSITDDFSGILSYNGYIDGKWALFEYDVKKNIIEYFFDPTRIARGDTHYLELVVVDQRQNITLFNMEFKY